MRTTLPSIDRPLVISCGFIVLILLAGTVYTMTTQGTATFLSANYLLLQLQFAAYLGIAAGGMMIVILLGHIDLSIPWTIAAGAMMATAVGGDAAIPTGLGVGLLIGLVNGTGVAVLRVPSMIFTLAVNTIVLGLMVVHTGGFAPQTSASPLMRALATGDVLGVPAAVLVWAAISAGLVFMLRATPMGRYIYAIGNREAAAYLSGVKTRLVLVGSFIICSLCAAFSGVLIAGLATKAYQGMGDEYLLPSIAAVVIGGTNILGGRGSYAGTVVGVILITLLGSVLSVMQMPQAGRQVIYGVVIIVMLLVYGRSEKTHG